MTFLCSTAEKPLRSQFPLYVFCFFSPHPSLPHLMLFYTNCCPCSGMPSWGREEGRGWQNFIKREGKLEPFTASETSTLFFTVKHCLQATLSVQWAVGLNPSEGCRLGPELRSAQWALQRRSHWSKSNRGERRKQRKQRKKKKNSFG